MDTTPSDSTTDFVKRGGTNPTCSANQNHPVQDFAKDPAWNTSMMACLSRFDNDDQGTGLSCQPKSADGSDLGPSFGFWRGIGEVPHLADPKVCYVYCQSCLARGLGWLRAERTVFVYDYGDKGTDGKEVGCQMRFDWGG